MFIIRCCLDQEAVYWVVNSQGGILEGHLLSHTGTEIGIWWPMAGYWDSAVISKDSLLQKICACG